MTNIIDLVGQTFERLTVLCQVDHYNGRASWLCKCSCGALKITDSKSLRTKSVSSCGCIRKTHGLSATPLHKVWASMRQRCANPRDPNYYRYGGRGISVCKRWDDFTLFLSDMGPCPGGGSIDRRDNDGNYEPLNCYWATGCAQQRNTRRNRHLTAGGRTMLQTDWDRELGGSSSTICRRLQSGWTEEQACLTPLGQRKK